jgi:hypothetical protein
MQVKVAPERPQLGQEANQILQAAAEQIDGPGRDHVDLAGGGVLQEPIESWALVATLGAADAGVLIETYNLPAGLCRLWSAPPSGAVREAG